MFGCSKNQVQSTEATKQPPPFLLIQNSHMGTNIVENDQSPKSIESQVFEKKN